MVTIVNEEKKLFDRCAGGNNTTYACHQNGNYEREVSASGCEVSDFIFYKKDMGNPIM